MFFSLWFYSPWTMPAIILITLLFIITYKKIEEMYLKDSWKFDWDNYVSDNSTRRDVLENWNHKSAKAVFFHRFAYSILFMILLTSFLKHWNLDPTESVGYSSETADAFFLLSGMAIFSVFIFTGFLQESKGKSILERLTGDKRKWLSWIFAIMIILMTFGIYILRSTLENTFLQEVATTFTITAGLAFIVGSYPKTIRFFTRKNFDNDIINPIGNRLQALLVEDRDAYIYHKDNVYIKCSKTLLPPKKLCKRSDCDCHLPSIDMEMTYIPRTGERYVSKSKRLVLNQSKLQICLKRFLGEAATGIKDFQINQLRISQYPPK